MSMQSVTRLFDALISRTVSLIWQPIARSINDFVGVGDISALLTENGINRVEMISELEALIARNKDQSAFSPYVETLYNNATKHARDRFFILMANLGLLVYDLFLVASYFIIPDRVPLMALLQIGLATPVIIFLIVSVARQKLSSNTGALISLTTITSTTLITICMTHSANAAIYAFALSLIIVGGNILIAVSFEIALKFTVGANIATALVLLLHPVITTDIAIFLIAVIVTSSSYSLIGNYRINSGLRSAYLHSLIERLRSQQLEFANERLSNLANIDGLTGLKNRRALDTALESLWSEKHGTDEAAVLMVDIDHFKALNDTYGHAGGDACLRQVSKLLTVAQHNPRVLVGRYGGEEFVILITNSNQQEAFELAENLRTSIEQSGMILDDSTQTIRLTVSVGCAVIQSSSPLTPAEFLHAADAALYKAKQSGRNQTQMASLRQPIHNDASCHYKFSS